MQVYLVQHGEAKSEFEDPRRPLTEKGKADVEKGARHVAGLGLRPAQILHSGKLRAQQTAEILSQYLKPPQGIIEIEGLAPTDDPQAGAALIRPAAQPMMLVGHLPHLSRLASFLILGSPDKRVIHFRMGGIVCLRLAEDGWAVQWVLTPELIQDF